MQPCVLPSGDPPAHYSPVAGGAVIGIDAAAIATRLDRKLGGEEGLFRPFIRRVQSGGFAVQAAILLLARSVSRLAYLQRCLPPAALEQVTAACVLDRAADEASKVDVRAMLVRQLRLGGFGLSSVVFVSPLAFIASVAASAAQAGTHPLLDGALPTASALHQWLRSALTCPAVDDIQRQPHGRHARYHVEHDADSFITHCHTQPSHAANLQHNLTAGELNLCMMPRWRK